MLFNSGVFVVIFLPIVVIGYYFFNKISEKSNTPWNLIWIFLTSLCFYGYEKPIFVLLIVFSIIFNYSCTKIMDRLPNQEKLVVVAGLLFDLGLLFYFKYFNFFMTNVYTLADKHWSWRNIFLPLGISFFTFQQVSYLIDYVKDSTNMDYSFWEYAAFVSFFPQLVAGPIVLHKELIPQFRDKSKQVVNYDNLSQGLYAFSLGLAKKVLLADTLCKIVSIGFRDVELINTGTGLVVMMAYALQIYFDFSGYCDMAMGIAKMFNITLPINFNSPYKAKSIQGFWKRWHITLTRFFTTYVYIPLGGSRKGKGRTYGNVFFIFVLSGLWHGASWTFILWGMLHGLLMTVERCFQDFAKLIKIKDSVIWRFIYRIFILSFINITWLVFRSDSIRSFFYYLQGLFCGNWNIDQLIIDKLDKMLEVRVLSRLCFGAIEEVFPSFFLIALLACCGFGVFFLKNTQQKMENFSYDLGKSIITIVLLVWSVFSFSDVGEFLYFNF